MAANIDALSSLHCRAGAPRLSDTELRKNLQPLAGWEYADNRIAKTFRFANYYETMAFVNAIAFIAHREDHHPDLSVHYNRAVVSYSTHDAGGVTLNDCICAAKIEALGA